MRRLVACAGGLLAAGLAVLPLGASAPAGRGDWAHSVRRFVEELRRPAPAAASAAPGTARLAGAAVLPSGRSGQVGMTLTAFASVIAAPGEAARGCSISPLSSIPAAFAYQTTNPASNAVTGTPNTPVDIPGGSTQTFVIAFTATDVFPPTEVQLSFDCVNTAPAAIVPGVNTLLMSASNTPVPDIVALAATAGNTGIVGIPGPLGVGVFSVATLNAGAVNVITASADAGTGMSTALICRTKRRTGQCFYPAATSVATLMRPGSTRTFAVFVLGNGAFFPLDPASNRVVVRFRDASSVIRGATSVAVQTQ